VAPPGPARGRPAGPGPRPRSGGTLPSGRSLSTPGMTIGPVGGIRKMDKSRRPAHGPVMTRRSRAREVALQLLFWRDANPGLARPAAERFVRERLRDPASEAYALELFDGVIGHQAEIDAKLTEAAENWRLVRMAAVDRNVLRVGAFELLHRTETPPAGVVNEAGQRAPPPGAEGTPGVRHRGLEPS